MLVLPALLALVTTAPPAPVRKPDPPLVSFTLRWLRQDPSATAGVAAPDPVVILEPVLTTLDGQVAFIEMKSEPKSGANDVLYVSLSPTVEPADDSGKAVDGSGAAKSEPTVRALWSLRISGKSLGGGARSIALTGATRLTLGGKSEGAIARFSLSDPATGRSTEFRLVGRATVEGTSAPAATP